jgi:hypothetical protein
MGRCVLEFERIQILFKKSDNAHQDNDFLFVNWFVGPNHVHTDPIKLQNLAGNPSLDVGDMLQPVKVEVPCADGDLVTASFLIVNLGSTDTSDQVAAAAEIGKQVSEKLIELYLKAAEEVVRNSGIPLSQVFADGIDKVAPAIVDTVGAAWDDVIVPLVDDVIDLFRKILGVPNCNGDVLHDIVVFKPSEPVAPELWTAPTYTASAKSGCGTPATTSVTYSRERIIDGLLDFGTPPPSATEIVPVRGGSMADWIAVWVSDPDPKSTTGGPDIVVSIEASRAASGSLAANITEHVDWRFNAEFDGGGDVLFPHTRSVMQFLGTIPASVRPFYNPTLTPGELTLRTGTVGPVPRGAGVPAATPHASLSQLSQALGLTWQRSSLSGGGVPLKSLFTDPAGGVATGLTDAVDTITIPSQGVMLCLYEIRQSGRTIGHLLRYIRQENTLYTRADWLLAHQVLV